MRYLAALLLLTSCSWASGAMNWADCSMPTYNGDRKDCGSNEPAQPAPRAPIGNSGPVRSAPMPSINDPIMMQQPQNPAAIMPPSYGQQPVARNAPPAPKDDFPEEYQNVNPSRDDTYDSMIPPPPI